MSVTDFQAFKVQKEKETTAAELVDFALTLEVDLSVAGLGRVLENVDKIVAYSGDVEPGERRRMKIVEPDLLLKAASTQRFTIEDMGFSIRLAFDGDYLYDLYHTMAPAVKQAALELLSGEQAFNVIKEKLISDRLRAALRNGIDHS